MTSDFRSEVEIGPFGACAMKNVQYNPGGITEIFAFAWKSGSTDTLVT